MTILPIPYRIDDYDYQIGLLTDRVNLLLGTSSIPFVPAKINDRDLQVRLLTDRVNRLIRDGTRPAATTDWRRGLFLGNSAASSDNVVLGNLTQLDAKTKVTVMAWYLITKPPNTGGSVGASPTVFSRYNNIVSATRQQLICDHHNTNRGPRMVMSDGAGDNLGFDPTALTLGIPYKTTWVYDGTLAGNANRVKIWRASYTEATDTWSADAQATLTFIGTIPATLTTPSASVNAIIGDVAGALAASTLCFTGVVYAVRVWIGTALTAAQIAAETFLVNSLTPDLMYDLNLTLNNTGSLAGFNGTKVGNATLIFP